MHRLAASNKMPHNWNTSLYHMNYQLEISLRLPTLNSLSAGFINLSLNQQNIDSFLCARKGISAIRNLLGAPFYRPQHDKHHIKLCVNSGAKSMHNHRRIFGWGGGGGGGVWGGGGWGEVGWGGGGGGGGGGVWGGLP